ncbi:MAG: hypothetical protein NT159_00535 [Proteobacteria bacterium]|nr:hypothetical protein [Pseudomonadota bacterium]
MSDEFINCPHWGKGGRYIVDADGKRQPVVEVPETVSSAPLAPVAGESAPPAASVITDPAAKDDSGLATTKKGTRNG